MPQTHCFPKHRDLRPSGFYAAAKDLGQNQSFKDFLLKKFKDSLASSQVWSDLFAFPLGTLRQVRNWPATTVRVTHSPVGPFFPAFTTQGRRVGRSPFPTKAVFQQPSQAAVLSWVKGLQSPSHQPGINQFTNEISITQVERQREERWEVKCHHFFLPLMVVRGPAPGLEAPHMRAHRLVFLVPVLEKLNVYQESFKHSCCLQLT